MRMAPLKSRSKGKEPKRVGMRKNPETLEGADMQEVGCLNFAETAIELAKRQTNEKWDEKIKAYMERPEKLEKQV